MNILVLGISIQKSCACCDAAGKGTLIKRFEVFLRRGESTISCISDNVAYGDAELRRGGLIVIEPMCTIF